MNLQAIANIIGILIVIVSFCISIWSLFYNMKQAKILDHAKETNRLLGEIHEELKRKK